MKCLVTGATGFLGKKVLELLIEDSEVTEIHVISRRRLSHPNKKVKTYCGDLVQPWENLGFGDSLRDVDKIIHLAGLYDFTRSYGESYSHNVLPALNLVDFVGSMKRKKLPDVLYASTYAVGAALTGSLLEEGPLPFLPHSSLSYPYTKALAEQILTRSGLPIQVFRLGALVGDSQTGEIEKIDGPYLLMRFLMQLKQSRMSGFIRKLPLPGSPNTILPLVPVDTAARVFHQALYSKKAGSGAEPEYYGVFRPESINVKALVEATFEECFSTCKPIFMERFGFHSSLFKLQEKVTRIPEEAFYFAMKSPSLSSDRFESRFGKDFIPHFNEYREPFFNGFRLLMRGGVAC